LTWGKVKRGKVECGLCAAGAIEGRADSRGSERNGNVKRGSDVMKVLRNILVIGVCGLVLNGCGGEEEETVPVTTAPGAGMEAGVEDVMEEVESGAEEVMEEGGEGVGEAAAALQEEYAGQLAAEESKLAALKAIAKPLGDERLTGMIAGIDEKVASARSKLSELGTADAGTMEGLKEELGKLMGEIPKLYEQAMARVEELKGAGLPEQPELPGGLDIPGK